MSDAVQTIIGQLDDIDTELSAMVSDEQDKEERENEGITSLPEEAAPEMDEARTHIQKAIEVLNEII